MKAISFLLCLGLNMSLIGQTRKVTGKVISEHMEPLPGVSIQNSDSILLGTTDDNGGFEIAIYSQSDQFLISWIGMEWTPIQLSTNCDHLDVILLYAGNYDYKSAKKVDRHRKKRFNKLPELHLAAYKQGVFKTQQPCYGREFISIKERLKEIRRIRRTKTPST